MSTMNRILLFPALLLSALLAMQVVASRASIVGLIGLLVFMIPRVGVWMVVVGGLGCFCLTIRLFLLND